MAGPGYRSTDGGTGLSVTTSSNATAIASHPNGRFVYVGLVQGVAGFSSNASTGQLTAITGGTQFPGPPNPNVNGVAVHPAGRFVYTSNNATASVSAYMVDGGNGALTPISTYSTGQFPKSVVVEPAGKFVYVAHNSGLSGYAIDQTTGELTTLSGVSVTGVMWSVAAAPNGQVLYASNGQQLFGYTINGTTGALTGISGFPVTQTLCCTQLSGLTVDPQGRFVYAATTSGVVSAYQVNAVTGALTAVAGSPFTVAASSVSMSAIVDASGKFLYVTNYPISSSVGRVAAFAINQSTGALTTIAGSPFATGSTQASAVTTARAVTASTATLQSVSISPSAPTISTATQGKKQQLVLIGQYSDGTAQFLTESATWSSSATSVATISNTAGNKGLATSVTYGSTMVTASFGGFTANATLTVAPAVVSVSLVPTERVDSDRFAGTVYRHRHLQRRIDGERQQSGDVVLVGSRRWRRSIAPAW